MLGIANVSDTLSKLDDTDHGIANVDTDTGKRQFLTVYESGLYELIFVSRKPQAKAFKRWIIEEVLPSIRKTGSYSVGSDGSDYDTMSIDELKESLARKKLKLEHLKTDKQLERYNVRKQAYSVIDDLKLAKIYRLVKRKGTITANDVRRYIWEFKNTTSTEINHLLLSLVELGKVEQIPTKKGIKVKLL